MKRILVSCLLLCICGQSIAAQAPTHSMFSGSKRVYLAAGLGDMFFRKEGENYLNTGTGWPDDHYSGGSISDQPYGFVEAGYSWERPDNWLPNYSLGLRMMYVSAASASGYIDQYSLPGFRNYTYFYDVQLFNLMGIYKIDLYRWRQLMPYVSLGAGLSSYTTTNYTEHATAGVTPRISPAFSDDAGVNLAYQLGVGFDFAVRENMSINVEANYANYGTVYTGKGANYSTLTGTNYDNESLKNTIAATSVFLGLTFYPA